MAKNILYSFIFASVLFVVWNTLLGYFPFLLFAIYLFVLLFSLLLSLKSLFQTKVTFMSSLHVYKRTDDIEILFKRDYQGWIQCSYIQVEYSIYQGEQCLIHRQFLLKDDEQKEVVSLPHCGYYTIHMTKIKCFDILQCFYHTQKDIQKASFYVFPKIMKINSFVSVESQMIQDVENYSLFHKGDDHTEVFEIRPYQDGDALKHIHWKASMKENELFVKEGSQPTTHYLLLTVDLTMNSDENDQTLDYFYSICLYLLNKGMIFKFLVPQKDSLEVVVIQNQDQLRDCMKRIMKYSYFYEPRHYLAFPNVCVVKRNEVEMI